MAWHLSVSCTKKVVLILEHTPLIRTILRLFWQLVQGGLKKEKRPSQPVVEFFSIAELREKLQRKKSLSFSRELPKQFFDEERIEFPFKHEGVLYGKEVVERIKTVELLKDLLPRSSAQFPHLDKKALSKKQMILNSMKQTWAAPNYYRLLCAKHGKNAKKYYLPALINMRYHWIEDKNGKEIMGLFRFGAITDPTNGNTYLQELKGEEREERRWVLSMQMLQFVGMQVFRHRQKIESMADGEKLLMVHLGLLNEQLNNQHEGIVQNEKHVMYDMWGIFKEFENKRLIFDGQALHLDAEGSIHLPLALEGRSRNSYKILVLSPLYFNISVQGYKKHEGLQRTINQESFGKLIPYIDVPAFENFLEVMRKLFEGRITHYDPAEQFLFAFKNLQIPLSTGCWGAKDRTGAVIANVFHRVFCENFRNKTLARKFPNTLLNEEAPALRIAYECTGEKVLKVMPEALRGGGLSPALKNYTDLTKATIRKSLKSEK